MTQHRDPDPDPKLEEVARLLDQVAAQEALEREEADALHGAPGLDRVEETLRGAWSAADRKARERAKIRWLGVFAAAAAILLFLFLRGGSEPAREGPSGEYLADPTLRVVEPAERSARWDRIAWTGPEKATYRVRVRNGQSGKVIYGPKVQSGCATMTLSAEDTAGWPKRIVIEVEMQLADGTWTSAEPRMSALEF